MEVRSSRKPVTTSLQCAGGQGASTAASESSQAGGQGASTPDIYRKG